MDTRVGWLDLIQVYKRAFTIVLLFDIILVGGSPIEVIGNAVAGTTVGMLYFVGITLYYRSK